MESNWLLLRCKCGHSFGAKQGGKASCNRCGESKLITTTAMFTDSAQLTEAVANANLPSEISEEIKQKLSEKKRKQLKTKDRANPGMIVRILKQSTDERGVFTLESLLQSLQSEGVTDPSPEQIIGMAEMQGVVQRTAQEEWKWLE
mgnify:FL=1|tara:strand:+ start:136 stop:573 length:438 start_codon:yes stop_codon:yes gene_type:complete